MDNETDKEWIALKKQELKTGCYRLAMQTVGLRPTADMSDKEVATMTDFSTILSHARQLHEWVSAA